MFEIVVFLFISGGLTLVALKIFGVDFWPDSSVGSSSDQEKLIPHFSINSDVSPYKNSDEFFEAPNRRPRGFMGTFFSFALIGVIGGAWYNFGSLDKAFRGGNSLPTAEAKAQPFPSDTDWVVVDGVRWFKLIGTDSGGIGYAGWVPELAFRDSPPASASVAKNFLQKMGFPDPEETAKAIKQVKEVSAKMKFHLDKQ